MSTPIVFIDRDGTVNPEFPAVRIMMQFHEAMLGRRGLNANQHLRRLVNRGAKLVWNSRNPDPIMRPKGRLHSMNKRKFTDPAAEHVKLLQESGIPDGWFWATAPEVIHCKGKTKGESMAAFCAVNGIPLENTIAFDNEPGNEMRGYPANRVIAVDSSKGITKENCDQAIALLNLFLPAPTAGSSGTLPRTPRQP